MARDQDQRGPEPDRVGDAPHPREAARVFGHDEAEGAVLSAWAADRLHHAWLLSGPRGVGKATLAYRIARARLTAEEGDGLFGAPPPPTSFDVDPEHPVARRILAGAEPRFFTLRRALDDKGDKLATVIRVDEVRALKSFFQLSAADGGWRVAVIDAAEEMNVSAANALLKLLEEPPAKALFLLVSHAPARLLPTIRSRCRALSLGPLGAGDLGAALAQAGIEAEGPARLAALAEGSAGEAVRLIEGGGLTLYARLVRLLSEAPKADRREMIALSDACAGRAAEPVYDLTLRLISLLLARLARAGATGRAPEEAAPGEARLISRLAAGPGAARVWAETAGATEERAARGRAVNLDPAQVMLDIFLALDAAAGRAQSA